MNAKLRMLLTVFIVLVCAFSTLKVVQISGQEEVKQDLVVKELSNVLKEWYYGVRSTAFKNITVNASLADDIQPVKIRDGRAEAVFYLKSTMIPKITLEEVQQSPYLKGMQRYLNENRNKLTDAQIKTVELAIKEKVDALKDIVGKLHEENGTFKVVCDVTPEGKIDKNSARIYYDISVKGEPQWEDVNISFVPSKINSEDDEVKGYNEVKSLIEKLYPSSVSSKQISVNSSYQNLYNQVNARYYADRYTNKAPYDKTITCWVWDSNTHRYVKEVSHYTDISFWNNSQYFLPKVTVNGEKHYRQIACNNCADFVSQAMYYGGMQADSYWNPACRLRAAPDGKWYWTYVPDLTDYMKSRGDWNTISYSSMDIGDVAVFWRYYNGRIERYHVAMCDYAYGYYGIYYNYFAAHTRDVKVHYYNSSSKYLYEVSCWRFAP